MKTVSLTTVLLFPMLLLSTACTPSQGDAAPSESASEPAAATAPSGAESEERAPEAGEAEAPDPAPAAAEGEASGEPGSVPPLGSETPEQILAAIPGEGQLSATFVTSHGEIRCTLHEDEVPLTVSNFVGLATGNKTWLDPRTNEPRRGAFYDGLIFHRVIPNFMIQGGDPLGQGVGGPGYRFEDEFHPRLRHDRPGTLAMANAGPATNGSQFYITDVPTPHLDNRHTVFGHCDNVDVVTRIANVPTGPGSRPLQDVVIDELRITRGD